jgi:hypothetical protein
MIVARAPVQATRFACLNWHYQRAMPVGKLISYGAWHDDTFWGVVVFGRGATPEIGKPYGLRQYEICELVRVAMKTGHPFPVSQAASVALRLLRKANPGLRLVVSFADSAQGHYGGIYQAMNWLYAGATNYHAYRVNGQLYHPKSLHSKYGKGGQSIPWLRKYIDPNAERIHTAEKHRYLYPLDAAMREQLEPLRLPYPRADRPVAGHPPHQAETAVRSRPRRLKANT